MKANKNTVLILICIFSVTFLAFTYFTGFLVTLVAGEQDITNLEVVYTSSSTETKSDKPTSAVTPNPDESIEPTDPNAVPDVPDSREEYTYTFLADLSQYEKYMNPAGDEYLTLINPDNRLAEDYVPEDLIEVINTRNDRSPRLMREYAAKALEALFIEAEANGMIYLNQNSGQVLSVMSGYRSYDEQKDLHEARKALLYPQYGERAGEMAAQIIQYPGASEHQSGLCCDMHNIASADVVFEKQEAATWLKENCYKFGFILRYPKDKVDITKVSFEPWHFRYVGRYHASKMHELDMCLEEYFEYLSK